MQIGGNTLQIVILLFILLKDGDEGVICEVTISKLAIFSVMEKNPLNVPFSFCRQSNIRALIAILGYVLCLLRSLFYYIISSFMFVMMMYNLNFL